ncbi:MAG: 2-oxoacid:ferredoxin oxidoreductase subunit beta [Desulfurivibrionaceae bacterium]
MSTSNEFKSDRKTAWCPGCGNFAILKTLQEALAEMGLSPGEVAVVSGIGQSGKLPHYMKCHTFNGLHGRTLPVATGLALSNHDMRVLAVAGDGDCYGEGGNHLLHAIRRNINVTLLVHNNQIYGLTKGQASPTSLPELPSKTQPFGNPSEPLNPLALAIAMNCGFVARGFAGGEGLPDLKELIKKAVNHPGFALVDIFQNCITFNRINTVKWYKEHTYFLEEEYEPGDRQTAFQRALENGEKLPLGLFYHSTERSAMAEKIPVLGSKPLIDQPFNREEALAEIGEFG